MTEASFADMAPDLPSKAKETPMEIKERMAVASELCESRILSGGICFRFSRHSPLVTRHCFCRVRRPRRGIHSGTWQHALAQAGVRGEGLRRPSAGFRREPVEIIVNIPSVHSVPRCPPSFLIHAPPATLKIPPIQI